MNIATFAVSIAVPLVLLAGLPSFGQSNADNVSGLSSPDWRERQKAFQIVAERQRRSVNEDKLLAALLLREFTPEPATPDTQPADDPSPDNDHLIDPERERYVGDLVNIVATIADRNPTVPGIWPALLASAAYDGHSGMMPWLASHSDWTAPYFLACAKGEAPCARPYDALLGLAKIISYERDPAAQHHLSASQVDDLDRAIRDRLNIGGDSQHPTEAEELQRMKAIEALGFIGNADDLKWLQDVAEADPYYDAQNQYYPFRLDAGLAASVLRKRLTARVDAKP